MSRGRTAIRFTAAGMIVAASVVVDAPAASAAAVVGPGGSIQAAVDAASPGATITVLPGTYHEAVCLTTDGIKLRGAGAVIVPPAQAPQTPCSFDPGGQTVGIAVIGQLDPDSGQVVDPVRDVTVSGFRVEGFAAFGIGVLGGSDVDIVGNTAVDNEEYGIARFESTGGSLRDNRVTGSDEAGLYLGDSPEAHATIVGNTAWDNGLFGIFVRDSGHGVVVGNESFGNCVGIMVLATQAQVPVEDWTVKGNRVYDNTKACPASEDGPPASGIGIALAGAARSTVLGNVVTGNRPAGPTLISGGVAVFSTAPLGDGVDPVGNLVKANQLRDNDPDLSYDGSGTGNTFAHNSCGTSNPAGLC
jgi:parallel beta-helix repeat protein